MYSFNHQDNVGVDPRSFRAPVTTKDQTAMVSRSGRIILQADWNHVLKSIFIFILCYVYTFVYQSFYLCHHTMHVYNRDIYMSVHNHTCRL